VRVNSEPIEFNDRAYGLQRQNVEEFCGDFVVLRADQLFAYQLAVVIDDRDQGVTDVVRGADLLESTARQVHLQRMIGDATPRYLHTPLALNPDGQKLSKQTLAPAIVASNAVALIHKALVFLGQNPPSDFDTKEELWQWAIAHWNADTLGKETAKNT
jgi:glutamyl-Q tRNA(Asp) synthetase